MSQFSGLASVAVQEARAYTAAILGALGDRDPFDVLRSTPAEVQRALAGVTPATLVRPERPGKWSMAQVVQHLGDAEVVGAYRFRMILAHERPELQGYDQDRWADRLRYADADVGGALDQFRALRAANVRLLERTSPEERRRVGIHAERGEESVEHLLRMYAGHDLVHLGQLARIARTIAAG
ncbi:MAG TPA: DinB family protein [Gemmatimonadales bacterium]|nr:DinB family protein [Gemmatimonadales bacterium]